MQEADVIAVIVSLQFIEKLLEETFFKLERNILASSNTNISRPSELPKSQLTEINLTLPIRHGSLTQKFLVDKCSRSFKIHDS